MSEIIDIKNPNGTPLENEAPAPLLDPNVRRIIVTLSPSLQGDRVQSQFEGFANIPEIDLLQMDVMLLQALSAVLQFKQNIFNAKMKMLEQQQQVQFAQQLLEKGRVQ